MVDFQMAANARMARLQTSLQTNPDFTLTEIGNGFDAGESAAYIAILGDIETGEVPRDRLVYFFGKACLVGYRTKGG